MTNTATTIERPFLQFTALTLETEEIRTCTSLKVLYNAIRRDMRYDPTEKRTVLFFKDLTDWSFESAIPFFRMEQLGTE